MITSHIDGRIRVKDKFLKDNNDIAILIGKLKRVKGIEKVRHTKEIGTLLVKYDPELFDKGKIILLIITTFYKKLSMKRSVRGSGVSNRYKRKIINWGMIGSFATSLISIYAGKKRLHIQSSYLFIGVMIAHVYLNRKGL